MKQIYESIKDLIGSDLIVKAANVLDEKEAKVSQATSSIISSLLGVILKNGDTARMRNILDEGGNLNILSDLDNICQERPSKDQQKIGDDFLQELLGDKAADFSNPIAEQTGISKVATNRLVSILAPIVAGYLGNRLHKEQSFPKLLQEIREEKNVFAANIPSKLAQSFGLASILNTGSAVKQPVENKPVEKKKDNSWWMWVLLVALLLILFFWWRSCSEPKDDMTYGSETVIAAPAEQPASETRAQVADTTSMRRDSMELTLPNGNRLQAYRGGMEEKMVNFLKSDDYKNAKDADLKNKWFEFDNIDFEFGSGTQLMGNSKQQVDNIIAILKNYKDAKIRIAGYADKVGSDEANMKLSKERANTIRMMMEKEGVGSQVVSTEGFGEEKATRSASAPDSERAKDRDIAFRFVK